jgi:ATP-dependent DNA helicase RecQ
VGGLVDKENSKFVEIFHGSLCDTTKKDITLEFVKISSSIRVMISTIAFGMGVEVPDIRHVVHWGPSSSTINYWQEAGR